MNAFFEFFSRLDTARWALVISIVAVLLTALGLIWQRKSAHANVSSAGAAQRSAEAAERSAAADEKMLEATLKIANAEEKAAAFSELTADPVTRRESSRPADVTWGIEHAGNALYLLYNTGSVTATGVTADPEPFKGLARQLPKDAAVRAGESLEFLLIQVAQESTPHEMWLTWDGQDEPIAVRIPPTSSW